MVHKRLFTVVICTYNGSKNIIEVLDSVCSCTNIDLYVDQVMVVDNASTDNIKELVLKYIENHPIVSYVYEERSGLSFARQQALNSKTDWVVYFDDDNLPSANWFVDAAKMIKDNKNLGVFGGRNIAVVREQLSLEEELNLKMMKSNLACHYSSETDYINRVNGSALTSVFGAGMTIKTEILKSFMEVGWTKGTGRKQDNLGAYEDSEIVNFAIKQGFICSNCDTIYLYHLLPKRRTSTDYILRLRRGMEDSEFNYILCSEKPINLRTKVLIRDIKKFLKYQYVNIFAKEVESKVFAKYVLISSKYGIKMYFPHILSVLKGKKSKNK